MAAHSLHVLFCVVFQNLYAIFTKNLYINTSISEIIERTTTGLYFRDLKLSAPPGPIMIFMISFDFHAHSVKSLTGNDAMVSG